MALTDVAIRNAKPKDKSYQMPDRDGLYLEVRPNGSKLWRFRYRFRGREHRLGLGKYPYIGLKEAREIHLAMRRQIALGRDPKLVREAERKASVNTFGAVAEEWLKIHQHKWAPSHTKAIRQRLDKNLLPWLGSRPIEDITPPDILEILRRIEARGAYETARRCLGICSQIFDFAQATGRCSRDPCHGLNKALAPAKPQHMAAPTDPAEVGRILRLIHAYPGVVGAALRIHPYLFCRPGELRQMRWADIDFDAAEWRFTLSKTSVPHITPLSRQALSILKELRPITGHTPWVFPSTRSDSRPMSSMAMLVAMRSIGIQKNELVSHGWRATARTLLEEVLGFAPHLIEQQLGHTVRDPLGRAYNRTTHLEARRTMMETWADYLDSLRDQIN